MNAQPKANEPSMEEILASIRRIIADDQAKAPVPEPAKPAPPVMDDAPLPEPAPPVVEPEPVVAQEPEPVEDDILDLDEPVAKPVVEAETPRNPDDIDLLFAEVPEDEAEPAMPEAVEPAPVAPMPAAFAAPEPLVQEAPPMQPMLAPAAVMPSGMDGLISGQVENHVQQAFASLAGTVMSNNARTLEDLVREMLKPMLKTWLDDNLPALVERLVRAEIERVARGGRV